MTVSSPHNRSGLLDGQWHQLHPMTPLLRSGLGLIAVIGFTITAFRDSLINLLFGFEQEEWDLWTLLQKYFLWFLLGTLVILLLISGLFYLSWRMSSFRVTAENIELRTGIIFKNHRQLPLDRVQDVSIQMPLFARLFGAAKFRIAAAGQGASLHLDYIPSRLTKTLRQDIFSRVQAAKAQPLENKTESETLEGSGLSQQVHEPTQIGQPDLNMQLEDMFRTEIDEDVEPDTLVHIPIRRMIASTIFSVPTGVLVTAIIVFMIFLFTSEIEDALAVFVISFLPGMIALAAFFFSRIRRMLRYSIAQTDHGIRMSYGLLSRSVHTIPQRRIHGVWIRQPLLWRLFGWWRVDITRASTIDAAAQGMNESTVLPVGKREDAQKVLALLLPDVDLTIRHELLEHALIGSGDAGGFHTATKRAFIYQPFTWKRNGWASDTVLGFMRTGYLSRKLSIIPLARVQGVTRKQGIFARLFQLSSLTVALVPGVVTTTLKNIDTTTVEYLFDDIEKRSIAVAQAEKGPER